MWPIDDERADLLAYLHMYVPCLGTYAVAAAPIEHRGNTEYIRGLMVPPPLRYVHACVRAMEIEIDATKGRLLVEYLPTYLMRRDRQAANP